MDCMGGWPTLEPQEALGWPILASLARVGLVFASLFMAPFCGFAKGAVFEFSFQCIQTMELTSLLLTYVQIRGMVACVISNKPR